ncbi:MAG: 4'-phosphopantetheinyl transferase superfamily protein [Caldilineae bacterium]|nr:MAG: 4'-phosphopantetheinyl transferase superfamily protein [Caldilineae bacterium]
MLYWLQQSSASYPPLAAGQPPPGLLHPEEMAEFTRLRTPRRRRDWLLGRWTAKHLLQRVLADGEGRYPALSRIVIANERGGAPYARLADGYRHTGCRLPYCLSISHTGHRGFCAVSLEPALFVGVDIERVVARPAAAWEDLLSPAERNFAQRVIAGEQDIYLTLFWSVKEAVFKALRLNGRAVPQAISCEPLLPARPHDWNPLGIDLDPTLITSAPTAGTYRAWWRVDDNYVLTLAIWSRAQGMSLTDDLLLAC